MALGVVGVIRPKHAGRGESEIDQAVSLGKKDQTAGKARQTYTPGDSAPFAMKQPPHQRRQHQKQPQARQIPPPCLAGDTVLIVDAPGGVGGQHPAEQGLGRPDVYVIAVIEDARHQVRSGEHPKSQQGHQPIGGQPLAAQGQQAAGQHRQSPCRQGIQRVDGQGVGKVHSRRGGKNPQKRAGGFFHQEKQGRQGKQDSQRCGVMPELSAGNS